MTLTLRLFVALAISLSSSVASAEQPLLVPAWQTTTSFDQPESVVLSNDGQYLFVSNVNGDPSQADGNGYISTLSLSGEIMEQQWLTGLDAPKGMTVVGDTLYVADINQLVVIDIKTKKISHRYSAPKAKFLNDVAADDAGNVYVSGFLTNSIYRLNKQSFTLWIQDEQLEVPNGLLVENNQLIVGSWGVMTDGFATTTAGHLKTIDISSKQIASLGDKTPAGNLDGVEIDGNGNYYVSDWMTGKLLHIQPSGISTTLLQLEQGSADHTVLAKQKLVIIPMMLSGNVVAYQIKQ